jgi:alkylation response protein AidB-like acyl-CoA dehydrogenase
MDFSLGEDRTILADSLRRTLARGADWAALAELGVLGALFSEAEGGFGGTGADLMVVFQELGRAGCDLPVLEAGLAGGLLADAGRSDEVAAIVAGALRATAALYEPGHRYELVPALTLAEGGRLTGRKTAVGGADEAGVIVVSALDGGAPALFLVRAGAAGLTLHTTPALHGGTVSEIALDGVAAERLDLPAGALAARVAAATLAVCADALGALETVRDLTLDYLRTRKQFGVPIGSFQALQHRMVDCVIEIEQARSAVMNLAGHLHAAPALRDRHVAATKNLMGRVCRQVTEEAIQMHGGIGVTAAYALAPLARRLTAFDHRFGDEDHHLARFIALTAA